MKNKRKIIFIDVDGTLVNYKNELPESAVIAIRKARSRGHRVYLCTGRSKAEIYEELWVIGLDGMIGGNGSYVEDDGKVILHRHLTRKQCSEIVCWLQERGLEFYLESNAGLFASAHFETGAASAIRQYARQKGERKAAKLQVKDAFPTMIFDGNLDREDVNKISFVLTSYQDYLAAKEAFPQLQVGTWGGQGELALFGDIGVEQVSKADAITALLRHLQADREDTIAFGDAQIDIPMLEYCALGIAMANGGKEIKAMADDITAAVDEDGLYQAFMKYQLIDSPIEDNKVVS